MAVTTAGAALTEAHRTEQAKNGALVAYVVAQLWLRSIDPNDLSGSAAALVARLIPILNIRRKTSAELSRRYYREFRKLEVQGADGFELPPISEMNIQALQTSLRVMGEVAVKTKLKGVPATDVDPDTGLARINPTFIRAAIRDQAPEFAAAATRHVMNGGRDEIQSALDNDPIALGYVRVTDGDPCFFCAMLASRGPVYDEDSFDESDPRFIGKGSHKVHDHDACTVEPVYSRKTNWPGRGREFEDMWNQLSKDLGRAPTIQDWRRLYEGRGNPAD